MNEPNSQGEPTMEEILASIRKIISEDGPEGQAEAAESDSEAPAAEAQEAEPDEDVLDLTQEVKEDGTVVDLSSKRTEPAEAPQPEPEPEAAPEPDPEPEPVAEASPEPTPVPEPQEVEDGGDLEFTESDPAEPPVMDEPVMDEPVIDESVMDEPVMEAPAPESVAASQVDDSDFLSEPTRTAATSSLMDLAVTAGLGAAAAQGAAGASGQTLEMLVREALKPYLKSWLDENLAPLVERIVREEIQKMVKRAEYR